MRVFKYQFEIEDDIEIKMPWHGQVLKVDMQDGKPTLWALVDDTYTTETRRFLLRGTGHPVPDDVMHRGTFFDGPFVWHLFEELQP